jgi:hypothetical protein
MEITEERWEELWPASTARGNLDPSNLQFHNAVLCVTEHGGKCSGLPKRFRQLACPVHTPELLVQS